MSTWEYAFGLLCVLVIFLVQGSVTASRADSFSYQLNVTATSLQGLGTLGTLTGHFTIDTNGVAFNACSPDGCPNGYNSYSDPSVGSGLLVWNPVGGPSVPLTVNSQVLTVEGGAEGGFGTKCTFAAGSYCPFMLSVGEPGETNGLIYIFGTLGEQLTTCCAAQSELTVYLPDGTFEQYPALAGVSDPVPEPGTFTLFFAGRDYDLAVRTCWCS